MTFDWLDTENGGRLAGRSGNKFCSFIRSGLKDVISWAHVLDNAKLSRNDICENLRNLLISYKEGGSYVSLQCSFWIDILACPFSGSV